MLQRDIDISTNLLFVGQHFKKPFWDAVRVKVMKPDPGKIGNQRQRLQKVSDISECVEIPPVGC